MQDCAAGQRQLSGPVPSRPRPAVLLDPAAAGVSKACPGWRPSSPSRGREDPAAALVAAWLATSAQRFSAASELFKRQMTRFGWERRRVRTSE
jgi:hypothetical protein